MTHTHWATVTEWLLVFHARQQCDHYVHWIRLNNFSSSTPKGRIHRQQCMRRKQQQQKKKKEVKRRWIEEAQFSVGRSGNVDIFLLVAALLRAIHAHVCTLSLIRVARRTNDYDDLNIISKEFERRAEKRKIVISFAISRLMYPSYMLCVSTFEQICSFCRFECLLLHLWMVTERICLLFVARPCCELSYDRHSITE